MTDAPGWMNEALAECPTEGAEVVRLVAALQDVPRGGPINEFIGLYERMLDARDALYQAWISRQMDEPEISGS